MKAGECPSCRAPLEFKPGLGQVKVCEFCNTVVLRGEASLEKLGKVAQLVDTDSPLSLNLAGQHAGAPFTVAGRIQKSNDSGTWDEWCLAFDDGRTAWLSESEGAWHLMVPLECVAVPEFTTLKPLSALKLHDRQFVVEEIGSAHTVSASGQLPEFNAQHDYVEATGPKGVFASVEYPEGATAEALVGTRVTLEQLGFDKNALQPTLKREALSQARCTECNGMLELRSPDSAKRVACPYCGALLDVSHGTLQFLQLLKKPPTEPLIPLGSEGTLDSVKWVCIAFLIRSCRVEGTRSPWEEYLLWNQAQGFRWLMNANGHWTLLTPIPAGEVVLSFQSARVNNVSYRAFQEVFTITDYVVGECYWQVNVAETAKATEYVAPPRSINLDQTATEVTFTAGSMLEPAEVSKAFRLKTPLKDPEGVAPAQLNPFKVKAAEAWRFTGVWALMLVLLVIAFASTGTTTQYFQGKFDIPAESTSGSPEAQRFSEPFEIPRKVPLEITVDAPELENNWLGVDVALVNTTNGEIISVYGETSHYSGVDDGESWSEGSRDSSKQTAEVDPGTYVVRVTPQFDAGRPTPFSVRVVADQGAGVLCPLVIFVLLLLVPVYYSSRASSFETRRWNEAVFQPSPGVSTFPYASSDDDDD